jgi:8-oxo-dGTP pyrophosphatase MutT (NUDIX family)
MFRKGVSALIINKNQEFLLVNLQSFKTHFFAVPGGGFEGDEFGIDAAYREIEEEIGINKKSLEFIGQCKEPLQFKFKTIKLNRDGKEYEGSERYFFGFRFTGNDNEIKLQEFEVRAYKWVSFNELKDYLLFDNQLEETSEKITELFPFFL